MTSIQILTTTMNYNFGEDIINYNYDTVQEEQFPNPLNYLNSDFGIQNK